MLAKGLVIAIVGASMAIGQNVFEPVTSRVQPADRKFATQLLENARGAYSLSRIGLAYDLQVSFVVDSGGATAFDGKWEMEDIFDPNQGLRWTAKAQAGYAITRISSKGMSWQSSTAAYIPLRLQEARAALFGAIPSGQWLSHDSLRTSQATFHGAQVTCILLSGRRVGANSSPRTWQETEECIDSNTGLLQLHSLVPGRYYSYDYSNAPQIGGHTFPRKITVIEGGKTVSEISVESLREIASPDPSLFTPSDEMRAKGRAIVMAEARKITRVERISGGASTPVAGAQPVCIFGLVAPWGELMEAHSLQPSDPNSEAALAAAQRLDFSHPVPPGSPPEQHFVFVIVSEK